MRSKKLNLIILNLFLVGILIYPTVIKSFHSHWTINYQLPNHNITLSKAEGYCYICHFEFEHFVSQIPNYPCTCQQISALLSLENVLESSKTIVYSYSLRAPPIA